MTKNELLDIQYFIHDMELSDEKIEVLERIYRWLVSKYREQGKNKLGEDFDNLLQY